MIEKYKRVYKHFLKQKIRLTTATLVAVLLGASAYGITENIPEHTLEHFFEVVIDKNDDKVDLEELNSLLGGILNNNDEKKINVERLNAFLGILSMGDSNDITISDKLNALIGVVSEGDGNNIDIHKLNALLGIFSSGDGNNISSDSYINSFLGIFSEGNNNNIDLNRLNALIGIISEGKENSLSVGQLNALIGIVSTGDDNNLSINEKINAAIGIINGGNGNNISVEKANALLGIFSSGNGNTMTSNHYMNALLGIFSSGDGNTIEVNRLNALVGIIADGNNNNISTEKVNALLAILATGSENNINNNDTINAAIGIIVGGDNNTVNSEKINALLAILAHGDSNTINNVGVINALIGIITDGNGNAINNTGDILAAKAITAKGDNNSIINAGSIIALNGIESVGDKSSIENNGSLISLGAFGLGGTGISSVGDDVNIKNNGNLFSVGIFADEINGIKAEGNNVKVENGGILIGASVGIKDGELSFGNTTGIEIIGKNSELKNSSIVLVLDSGNGGSKGINSIGDGGLIENKAFLVVTSLDLDHILNLLPDLSSGDIGLDTILDLLGVFEGQGIAINSEGNDKVIKNAYGTLIANTGISSIGDRNHISNSGDAVGGSITIANSDNGLGIYSKGEYNTISNQGSTLGGVIKLTNSENGVGIFSHGDHNNISNSGTAAGGAITIKDSKNGIGISSIGNNVNIRNTNSSLARLGGGSITVEGSEDGIAIKTVGDHNTIYNKNSSITAKNGLNVFAIKAEGNSIKIENLGEKGLLNSYTYGKIHASGENARGVYISGDLAELINQIGEIKADGSHSVAVEIKGNHAHVTNNDRGTIEANGDHSKALWIEGDNTTVTNNSGAKIIANGSHSIAVDLEGSNINFNNKGTIEVSGDHSIALNYTETHTKNGHEASSKIHNEGTIVANGNHSTGVLLNGNVSFTNKGNIHMKGEESLGVLAAHGADAVNSGVITLDKSSSVAMLADGHGSSVTNKGTIKLNYLHRAELEEKELNDLKAHILQSENDGTDLNRGIIKNANGEIVYAGGDHIVSVYKEKVGFDGEHTHYTIKDMEKDTAVKTDYTINITGSVLNGVLNADKTFDKDDFLLDVNSNKLAINGVLNAVELGVSISNGSNVVLNGAINADKTAVLLKGNSSFASHGGFINGDILGADHSNSHISLENGSSLTGNIHTGSGNDKVSITGGSTINGDIHLGDGEDELTIDSLSGNLISSTVLDGGYGKDILNIGTKGEVTTIKGTIKNFETHNFSGTIFLDSQAKLQKDSLQKDGEGYGKGDIDISNGHIVLGISETKDGYNHALTDIKGNTISGEGNFYADTRELSIGKNGISIDLCDTKLDLNDEQLKSTQFIYKVNLDSSSTKLNIDLIRDLAQLGGNDRYNDVWYSITEAGQEEYLQNTITKGYDALNTIFYQLKDANVYSLGTKASYDSLKLYQYGTENFTVSPDMNQWLMQAKVLGSYEKKDGDYSTAEINTTGVIVAGEYGLAHDASVGLSFGYTGQNASFDGTPGDLDINSFYFGAYAKKNINNFNLLAGAGYQYNRADASHILDNGIDRFEHDKNFDINGFNIYGAVNYLYELPQDWVLKPQLSLAVNYLAQDSINEGNSPMAVSTDSVNSTVVDFNIGAGIAKNFVNQYGKGGIQLSLSQQISGGDLDKNITAKFNGVETSDFTIVSPKIQRSKTIIEPAFDIENTNGFFGGVSYAYEFGNDFNNHKFTIGAGYKF